MTNAISGHPVLLNKRAGIVCKLDFGDESDRVVYPSITHPRVDPRQPLAREVASYQKHRVEVTLSDDA
jgi:hypothetical protein